MTKPIEYGTVEVELFGRTVVMTGTPRATFAIDDRLGGARSAIEALERFNRKAMATIIEVSAKLSSDERARLAEEVCSKPVAELLEPCMELIAITMNGGHPIKRDGLPSVLDESGRVEGNA